MLKLKYLYENYELAKEALTFYEYDMDTLEEMLMHFRISSNAVYPFRSADKREIRFLRLSPIVEKPFAQVEAEIHLTRWLLENGFPVMKPVRMNTGKYAEILDTQWGQYTVSCYAKVEGVSLEDAAGDLTLVRGYGVLLGRLHKMMTEYPDAGKHRSYRDLLDEIGERLQKYQAPDVVVREYKEVSGQLTKVSVNRDTYGVVHYDFEPDNVFYDSKSGKFSVIDLDDAIQCWYALDIVRALDGLGDVVETENLQQAERIFLNGYSSEKLLSQEQIQSFSWMRRLVHLQEYATLLHVLSEPVEEMPEWMVLLIQKLKYKRQQLENEMRNRYADSI